MRRLSSTTQFLLCVPVFLRATLYCSQCWLPIGTTQARRTIGGGCILIWGGRKPRGQDLVKIITWPRLDVSFGTLVSRGIDAVHGTRIMAKIYNPLLCNLKTLKGSIFHQHGLLPSVPPSLSPSPMHGSKALVAYNVPNGRSYWLLCELLWAGKAVDYFSDAQFDSIVLDSYLCLVKSFLFGEWCSFHKSPQEIWETVALNRSVVLLFH